MLYYYQLNPINIHQKNRKFYFYIDQTLYVLLPCERQPEKVQVLYELGTYLNHTNYQCHELVINQFQQIITEINHIPYVLLRVFIQKNQIVTLDEIALFGYVPIDITRFSILRRDNWQELWENKIDYLEYQVSQFGKKYPLIRESFSYYVGLTETAILFLKLIQKEENSRIVIAHHRLQVQDTLFSFYNPLNFVLDYKVRDAAEYLKDAFFQGKDILNQIPSYIQSQGYTIFDCQMFFARMLYPSYYFDAYDQVLHNHVSQEHMKYILNRCESYQQFLRELYFYLKSIIPMPEIEWLIKL